MYSGYKYPPYEMKNTLDQRICHALTRGCFLIVSTLPRVLFHVHVPAAKVLLTYSPQYGRTLSMTSYQVVDQPASREPLKPETLVRLTRCVYSSGVSPCCCSSGPSAPAPSSRVLTGMDQRGKYHVGHHLFNYDSHHLRYFVFAPIGIPSLPFAPFRVRHTRLAASTSA
jgi:hypothetical protein